MKKILLMSMLLLGVMVGFTSCSDDDNDNGSGIKETDKEMSLTVSIKNAEAQIIAYFENDVCTSGEAVVKCTSEYAAQVLIVTLKTTGAPATINGTTITVDLTSTLKGLNKTQVRQFLENDAKTYIELFTKILENV